MHQRPCALLFRLAARTRPSTPFRTGSRSFGTQQQRRGGGVGAVGLAARVVVVGCGIGFCLFGMVTTTEEQTIEWQFPTPHDWGMLARFYMRRALALADNEFKTWTDWAQIADLAQRTLGRLDDGGTASAPAPPDPDPDLVLDLPAPDGSSDPTAPDISARSEPWRRGYFQASMLMAQAAEHLEGFVRDTTRAGILFPPAHVIGPSNPNPKPVLRGMPAGPREQNCTPAYPPPAQLYGRLLATRGLTHRQRMDAALAYASYLLYRKRPVQAERVHRYALSLALHSADGTDSSPPPQPLFDATTLVLDPDAGHPPANVLDALTALATFRASIGDMAGALPILVSVLRARRGLPLPPPEGRRITRMPIEAVLWDYISYPFREPPYPPAADDGTTPPVRDALERCKEAGVEAYLGEILFALGRRDDGLAWTREAVDTAEETMRALRPRIERGSEQVLAPIRASCSECLQTGLRNWTAMAAQLVRDEQAQAAARSAHAVVSPFYKQAPAGQAGPGGDSRWEQEQKVIEERRRRTSDLVENLHPLKLTFMSLFQM